MKNIGCRERDTVKLALLELYSMPNMSWGRLSKIFGIPKGTLWDIAHGKPVPKKWRARRYKDLNAMSTKELRWALENREEA